MKEPGYRSDLHRLLEESSDRNGIEHGIDTDLRLETSGYGGLEDYARETLESYSDMKEPAQMIELSRDLKNNVTDLLAYKEVFEQKLDFIDDMDRLLEEEDYEWARKYAEQNRELVEDSPVTERDLSIISGLRNGRLYDRLVSMSENDTWDQASLQQDSMFDGVREVSGALMADYFFRGGKGLRSTLGMITQYGFEGSIDYETILMGANVEVFHTSTLLQDDLMDDDTERRGRDSANVISESLFGERGEDIPILLGNIMNAWTDQVINHPELDIPQESINAFTSADEKVNYGQGEDILMGENLEDVDLDDYKRMSMGKTGRLYQAVMRMAAENSMENLDYLRREREEFRESLDDYSFHLNLAFQASDDLIEVVSNNTGKSESDISNRKKTAPAITTKRKLEMKGSEVDGWPKDEYFLQVFDTDPQDDPTENIEAVEGVEFSERIYDSWIRRMIADEESTHRRQLEHWADLAAEAAEDLTGIREEGFSEEAANLYGKTAEAMNQRTK